MPEQYQVIKQTQLTPESVQRANAFTQQDILRAGAPTNDYSVDAIESRARLRNGQSAVPGETIGRTVAYETYMTPEELLADTKARAQAQAAQQRATMPTGNGYVSVADLNRATNGSDTSPSAPAAPSTTPTVPSTAPSTAPSATPSGSMQAGVAQSASPAAPANTAGRVVSPEGYTLRGYTAQEAPELQYYRAQAEQVGNVYDAARDAQLLALENQYNLSRAESQRAAEQIPQAYQAQALAAERQAARDRLAFNEQAAASGLNVGAGSQAQLAQNAALQGNLASIGTARANAEAEAQFQLMQMERQYQNAVSEALANNEYERAAALMQEYQREAQSTVEAANQRALLNFQEQQAAARSAQETANQQAALDYELRRQNMTDAEKRAATLAQYGDFSGYGELGYSPAEQNAMKQAWIAQNPELAVAMGYRQPSYSGPATPDDGTAAYNALDRATQSMLEMAIQTGNDNYLRNIMATSRDSANVARAQAAQNWLDTYAP